jgi:hypothetical protein
MDTGTVVGYFVGGGLLLALGVGLILLVVLKGFRDPNPNVTVTVTDSTGRSTTTQAGRSGLWLFIIVGAVIGGFGIYVLIRGIIYVASP